jgi:uncharacterized protein
MLGQLNPQEIEEMLKNNKIGRIGCNDGEKTYVVPVSYVYENSALFCHSKDGMKIEMMRRNPAVCFEIDEIIDDNHWRCVIAWGVYDELTDDEEVEHARSFFSEYQLEKKTDESALPPDTQEERFHAIKQDYAPAIYYRINLTQATGRFEQYL